MLHFSELSESNKEPKLCGKSYIKWEKNSFPDSFGFFNMKNQIKHGTSEEYDKLLKSLKSNNQYLVFMNLQSNDCNDECSSRIIMPTPKNIIVGSNKELRIQGESELSYLCVPFTSND